MLKSIHTDQTDVDGFNLAILPRLRAEVERHIQDSGSVIELVAYAPAKGGGWVATLDTEYAALKLHYAYRHCVNVRMRRAWRHAGWSVSI